MQQEQENKGNKPTAPLISVIVPIYNVEKYVRKCLDSLRGQTLREIEVICIDDGSTDRSGEIADEYAAEDERFRVIHTENRGLSAASNRGIDEAKAEWIMFVDSDDWVSPDFCRIPYEADMVIFGFHKTSGKTDHCSQENTIEIIDEFTAHEFGEVVVWNKLYCRCLFDGIRYPGNRVFEDHATTHKLVHIAEKIMMLPDRLYYYNERKNSISNTFSPENTKDYFMSALERYEDLTIYGYPEEKLKTIICVASIRFLSRMLPCDELYEEAKGIINNFDGTPRGLSIKQRIALLTWRHNEKLFGVLSQISGRTKQRKGWI